MLTGCRALGRSLGLRPSRGSVPPETEAHALSAPSSRGAEAPRKGELPVEAEDRAREAARAAGAPTAGREVPGAGWLRHVLQAGGPGAPRPRSSGARDGAPLCFQRPWENGLPFASPERGPGLRPGARLEGQLEPAG